MIMMGRDVIKYNENPGRCGKGAEGKIAPPKTVRVIFERIVHYGNFSSSDCGIAVSYAESFARLRASSHELRVSLGRAVSCQSTISVQPTMDFEALHSQLACCVRKA